jgi:hypothetical protein
MYKLFFLLIFIADVSFAQSSIYDLSFSTRDNNRLSLKMFKGKKIIILPTINSRNEIESNIRFCDSLTNRFDNLVAIILPVIDVSAVNIMAESLQLSVKRPDNVWVVAPCNGSKKSRQKQDELTRWLTNVSENKHFDSDIQAVGQFFLIGERGDLYSVLQRDIPTSILTEVINQPNF